ncbi:MAG TPA: hypothetical protein VK400_19130 [Pyrinomonadaceae bacterium]|nr:hypothetical protein [Pyrinomonadaceae bacterium]
MSYLQKHSGVVKGFLLGSLLVFSLMFIVSSGNREEQPAQKTISFDEAVARIETDDIKEIRIKNGTAEFLSDGQLAYATDVSERRMSLLLRQLGSEVEKVSFAPEPKDPLIYLFQILFWLFFISPPVIVVLLLVIIKKMDAKS